MGSDLEGVFVPGVEGFGEGSRNGETRRRVVEAVEKTRSKSLAEHRPKKTRHVWAWRQDCPLMAPFTSWPRHSTEQ